MSKAHDMVALRGRFEIGFQSTVPSPVLLVLRPRIDARQWVLQDSFSITPPVAVSEYLDNQGNRCQRLVLPEGASTIRGEVTAWVAKRLSQSPGAGFVPIQDLPDRVIPYLLPSRYCESDRLGSLAREIIGDATVAQDQVVRICDWLREHVAYRPGSSNTLVTAMEVQARGEGVCRDLAHLGVALCRSLSIPARFVSGYLENLEPMDLHAWFEAWLEGGWQGFDPTQSVTTGGRIILAVGRDAADVPIFNQFGPLLIPNPLDFSVERIEANTLR